MKLLMARNEVQGGPFVVTEDEAKCLNSKGFGVFYTVNSFNTRRITEDLECLLAWHVDLDSGEKEEQRKRINACPVLPSIITETKRGYQCQWLGSGFSDLSTGIYKEIEERLIEILKADPNAKDVCRIHRASGYYHMKDPLNPFMVREVYKSNTTYTESWILNAIRKTRPKKITKKYTGEVYDCKSGLMKLSGSPALNGDTITFKRNSNGTEQIWVNGKSTACWIALDGHIGSHAKGGPQLKHWVMFYGYTWRDALDILRKELGDGIYSKTISQYRTGSGTSKTDEMFNRPQEST